MNSVWFAVLMSHNAFAAQVKGIEFVPNPPIMGKQSVKIFIQSESGKPTKAKELSAEAIMPASTNMPLMKSEVKKITDSATGTYSGQFNISMEGTWYLDIKLDSKNYYFKFVTGQKGAESVKNIPTTEEHKHH